MRTRPLPAITLAFLFVSVVPGVAQPSPSFAPAVTFTTGNLPAAVATGDFNGDEQLDLVTANAQANTVSILFGNGSGGFTRSDVAVGRVPHGIAQPSGRSLA